MTLIGGITLGQHILMYADTKVTTMTTLDKSLDGNKILSYGNMCILTSGNLSYHNQLSYFIESKSYKNEELVFTHIQRARTKNKQYKWDATLVGAFLNSFYSWIDLAGIFNESKGEPALHFFGTPDGIFSGIGGTSALESYFVHQAHGTGSYSAMSIADLYKQFNISSEVLTLSTFLYQVFKVSANMTDSVDFPYAMSVIKRNKKNNYPKNSSYFSLDKRGNQIYTITSEEDIVNALKKEKVANNLKL